MIYNHNMKDPLIDLHQRYGYSYDLIKNVIFGDLYTLIETHNNRSGIASTLGCVPSETPTKIDFKSVAHRSIYTAYLNALINPDSICTTSVDIISEMRLESNEKIVMIGYFRPIIGIFDNYTENLSVFDDNHNDPIVLPSKLKKEKIQNADVLILTATTIINNSFCKEISDSPKNARKYLLGPSSIMSDYFKKNHGITKIFGSKIVHLAELKKSILDNFGTPGFSKFLKKIQF